MGYKLKNKNILLIGCTGVLGSEFLNYLYQSGANLILADIDKRKFKSIKKEFPQTSLIKCDVTKEEDIKRLKKFISKKMKFLDSIVYNAGLTSRLGRNRKDKFPNFEKYSLKSWKLSIDINLTGAFLISKYLINFLKNKKGSMIFISSIYGILAPDQRIYKSQNFKTLAGYSSSKAGLIGLSKWLATNFAKYKIRVNTIVPGGIQAGQNKRFIKNYSNRVPIGRMAKKHEINGILAYLISEDSTYVTGQEFIVDGGLSAW